MRRFIAFITGFVPLLAPGQAPASPGGPPATPAQKAPAAEKPAPPSAPNRYVDRTSGVSGDLPETWSMLRSQKRGSEASAQFSDSRYPLAQPSLYYQIYAQPQALSEAELETAMRAEAKRKTQQRIDSGLKDYAAGEARARKIKGNPALSWRATFTREGAAWTEALTRVNTSKGTYLFFLQAPDDIVEKIMPAFERFIAAAQLP